MSYSPVLYTRRQSIGLGLGFALLAARSKAGAAEAVASRSGSIPKFTEHLVWDKFTYVFGLQAADLDGDGFTDLIATDTDGFVQTEPFAGEPPPAVPAPKARLGGDFAPDWAPRNSNLYW